MFPVFHFFVVIPGHNLGNSQVSVYRTIGPTLVFPCCCYVQHSAGCGDYMYISK